jgi:hypothetical protein
MIYAAKITVLTVTIALFALWVLLGLGWLFIPSHRETLSMARYGGLFDDWFMGCMTVAVLDFIRKRVVTLDFKIGGSTQQ